MFNISSVTILCFVKYFLISNEYTKAFVLFRKTYRSFCWRVSISIRQTLCCAHNHIKCYAFVGHFKTTETCEETGEVDAAIAVSSRLVLVGIKCQCVVATRLVWARGEAGPGAQYKLEVLCRWSVNWPRVKQVRTWARSLWQTLVY